MKKTAKEVTPDDSELKQRLGEIYSAYKEIVTLTEGYLHEWKYYGQKYGWQFKVIRKGKALLWLTPAEGSFRVGFAVRENERQALIDSNLPAKTKEELTAAKKYAEGYPLRLSVTRKSDMKPVRLAIETLKSMRQ
jgi:hypothetical protein